MNNHGFAPAGSPRASPPFSVGYTLLSRCR